MKTVITCSAILGIAGCAFPLLAQSVSVSPIESTGTSMCIPADYAVDGKSSLVSAVISSNDGTASVSVYDENLDKVADIAFPSIPVRPGSWRGYADEFEFNISKQRDEAQYYSIPLSELDGYIAKWLGEGVEYKLEEMGGYTYAIPVSGDENDKWMYNDFFEFGIYGMKYPARAVCLKEYGEVTGGVYFVDWRDCYTPVHWPEPTDSDIQSGSYQTPYIAFYVEDFNGGSRSAASLVLTQTLFNSDGAYEYIAPVLERIQTYYTHDYIYAMAEYGVFQKGFRIMSGNGNELQTINFPEGYYGSVQSLVNIGSKTYLKAYVQPREKGDAMYLFYAIDRKGPETGVNALPVAVSTSVQPTVVREGEPVRVYVHDTAAASGLTVTDMGGRTVYSALLPEDGSYTIPGSAMRQGINIVTVAPEDGAPVSTKVLVK